MNQDYQRIDLYQALLEGRYDDSFTQIKTACEANKQLNFNEKFDFNE